MALTTYRTKLVREIVSARNRLQQRQKRFRSPRRHVDAQVSRCTDLLSRLRK